MWNRTNWKQMITYDTKDHLYIAVEQGTIVGQCNQWGCFPPSFEGTLVIMNNCTHIIQYFTVNFNQNRYQSFLEGWYASADASSCLIFSSIACAVSLLNEILAMVKELHVKFHSNYIPKLSSWMICLSWCIIMPNLLLYCLREYS